LRAKRILIRHEEVVVDLASGINLASSGFLDEEATEMYSDLGSSNNGSNAGTSVAALGTLELWHFGMSARGLLERTIQKPCPRQLPSIAC
jgi:hypothetical protein